MSRYIMIRRLRGPAYLLLVGALALHLAGGLRLLAVEFLPWSEWQKSLIALTASFAVAVSLLYLLWGAA